jgi:predicted DNA-binding transcriptional regulator YafY
MADRISKTQRWLDLIALLVGRRVPLPVEDIMERVPAYASNWNSEERTKRESVRRMFERDKDELRQMGIPIESFAYEPSWGGDRTEGYRIVNKDFYLPYLRVLAGSGGERPVPSGSVDLRVDEARALLDAARRIEQLPAFPMAAEARSAAAKLSFDLDPDQFPAPPIIWVESPGAADVLDRLRILTDALLSAKRVRFRYHGIRRGTPTEREVEPYGLFFQRDWYLVARDLEREALRVFRVSRMEQLQPNTLAPKSRDYEVPSDFRLRDFVGRPAWKLDDEEPFSVSVRFSFPASLLVARNEQGDLVTEEEGGAAVRRFDVTDPDPFLRWVLGFAGEATVVSPPELCHRFNEMAERAMALYGRRDA